MNKRDSHIPKQAKGRPSPPVAHNKGRRFRDREGGSSHTLGKEFASPGDILIGAALALAMVWAMNVCSSFREPNSETDGKVPAGEIGSGEENAKQKDALHTNVGIHSKNVMIVTDENGTRAWDMDTWAPLDAKDAARAEQEVDDAMQDVEAAMEESDKTMRQMGIDMREMWNSSQQDSGKKFQDMVPVDE
jgi:hypothetical protein